MTVNATSSRTSGRSPNVAGPEDAELTIIIVSYNTKQLTLDCLRSLYENTHIARFHTVVLDNASADGSAEAIAGNFRRSN